MGRPRGMVFPRQGVRVAGSKRQAARVFDDGAVVERESLCQGPWTCGGVVFVRWVAVSWSGLAGFLALALVFCTRLMCTV